MREKSSRLLQRSSTLDVYSRYKARDSGKEAQRSAGGVNNIAFHLVAINYSCFMGKIDGTCGAFLSVVTPGDCRREARLHLNRWHRWRRAQPAFTQVFTAFVPRKTLQDFLTHGLPNLEDCRETKWRRVSYPVI